MCGQLLFPSQLFVCLFSFSLSFSFFFLMRRRLSPSVFVLFAAALAAAAAQEDGGQRPAGPDLPFDYLCMPASGYARAVLNASGHATHCECAGYSPRCKNSPAPDRVPDTSPETLEQYRARIQPCQVFLALPSLCDFEFCFVLFFIYSKKKCFFFFLTDNLWRG